MSDLTRNPFIMAGGGALAGLVLGMLLSNASTDRKISDGIDQALSSLQEQQQDVTAKATAALSEQIAALETVVGDSHGEVSGLAATMTKRLDDMSDDLKAGFAAHTDELGDAIRGASKGSTAALALLSSSVSQNRTAAARAPKDDVATSTQAAEPDVAEEISPAGKSFGPGETAVFAEGGVRVFVSRLDQADQSARLSINGATTRIQAGQATVVPYSGGTCLVGLTSLSPAGAVVSSDCDAPLAGPTYSAGEMAMFGDGALRIFVSGLLDGGARLAINGVTTQVVHVGEPISVVAGDKSCSVSVTGIRDGALALQGTCS